MVWILKHTWEESKLLVVRKLTVTVFKYLIDHLIPLSSIWRSNLPFFEYELVLFIFLFIYFLILFLNFT